MKAKRQTSMIKTLLAASCASILGIAPQALADSVPGAVNDHVTLGTAYNRFSGKFLNFQPIKGEIQQSGNTTSHILVTQDMNFRQLSSRLSGEIAISADFPAVQADAGASLALESASDTYSSNWVFSVINKSKSQVLRGIDNAPSPELSASGLTIANQYTTAQLNDTQLLARVGSDYVSEIEYGSQLFVSMKMDFLNSTDKQNIAGHISVEAASGVVSVDGEINSMSQDVKKSVKITVNAHQFGGSPLGLLEILPDNILSCDLTNAAACFDLFENAVQYARGLGDWAGNGFKDQAIDIAYANVIGYQTTAYNDGSAQMQALVPPSYTITDNSNTINQLEGEYAAELTNRGRAQSMLKFYASNLSQSQRTELSNINLASTNNAFALASLADKCRDSYLGNDCANYIADNCPVSGQSRTCLESYGTIVFNSALLDTSFSQYRPLKDINKCLTVNSNNLANSVDVILADCNDSALQDWRYNPVTELLETPNGFCLDNHGATSSTSNVYIVSCNLNNVNQQWYFDTEQRLISRSSNLALDYNINTGNAYQFTIHFSSTQKWTTDPQLTLSWASSGVGRDNLLSQGLHCTQIHESSDPHTWLDNYLCSDVGTGMKWNSAGPIANMACTQIIEPSDPHTWDDNYLCLPNNSPFEFAWGYSNAMRDNIISNGYDCTKIVESSDPDAWDDNYLCHRPKQ